MFVNNLFFLKSLFRGGGWQRIDEKLKHMGKRGILGGKFHRSNRKETLSEIIIDKEIINPAWNKKDGGNYSIGK